jgi:choline dehydrogenase-like flavoprotein
MNAMVYIRGNRTDYDKCVSMGAAGWGYDAVLPVLHKKAEDMSGGRTGSRVWEVRSRFARAGR